MMTNRLKLALKVLSKKYSWHTLGEAEHFSTTRSINLASKQDVLISERKGPAVRSVGHTVPTPSAKKVKMATKATEPKRAVIPSVTQNTSSKIIKFKLNTKSKTLLAQRDALTMEIFQEYNEIAFDSMLPADMMISWSKRLTSTAGITRMSTTSRGANKV